MPYRGTAPAVNDMLSGTIPLLWSTPVGLMQFVEKRQAARACGIDSKRVRLLPDVPALSEQFARALHGSVAWHRGPAGLPDDVTAKLGQAIREIAAAAGGAASASPIPRKTSNICRPRNFASGSRRSGALGCRGPRCGNSTELNSL